jgi:undecaprenyl-diphosphatase
MALLVWVFFVVLLPLKIFGELADEVWEHEGFAWDETILRYLKAHADPRLDIFFLLFTLLGAARIMIPFSCAVIFWLLRRKKPVEALFYGVAAFGAMLLSLGSKQVFGRARPDFWISLAPETTLSFPSGHAVTSMAVAAALITLAWHTSWRWHALFCGAGFVLLVGLSRLYLGVHFPSDVLAGWCASLVWVMGVHGVLHAHQRRYYQRGRDWFLRRGTMKSSAES